MERMMTNLLKINIIFFTVVTLSACSMSGYGGSSQFRCRSEWGESNDPLCSSITQNYDASVAGILGVNERLRSNNLYSQQEAKTLMQIETLYSGTPLRSQTETARIWIAPYLDNDGDLVDQNYTYITLNQGRWLLGHNQQHIMDEYRPVRLLGGGKPSENLPSQNNQNNDTPKVLSEHNQKSMQYDDSMIQDFVPGIGPIFKPSDTSNH